MKVEVFKTKVVRPGDDLLPLLVGAIGDLAEGSVVAITSKIIALCQGRVVKFGAVKKSELIELESECFIPADENKYGIILTIKDSILIPSAGIDESNGDGFYVLWPSEIQETTDQIRAVLRQQFKLKDLGVVVTDSKTTPLRRGTTGVAIGHSGFGALNNYVGSPDIFGRKLHVTQANIMDGLAAAAVLMMGEGNEQTPIAVITDVPFVNFALNDPTSVDLEHLRIPIEEDLYAPLIQSEKWVVGGSGLKR